MESVGAAGGEFGVDQSVDGMRVHCSMESDGEIEQLDDLQWADWDAEGRLLAATRSGRLQIRHIESGRSTTLFEEDLSHLEPNPVRAPDWAERW